MLGKSNNDKMPKVTARTKNTIRYRIDFARQIIPLFVYSGLALLGLVLIALDGLFWEGNHGQWLIAIIIGLIFGALELYIGGNVWDQYFKFKKWFRTTNRTM